MKNKLKWKVEEATTGPYRSFFKRNWPMATIKETGQLAIALRCETSYVPSLVKMGKHSEITISVADYRRDGKGFDWKNLKEKANSLSEAKEIAQNFVDKHPEWFVNS